MQIFLNHCKPHLKLRFSHFSARGACIKIRAPLTRGRCTAGRFVKNLPGANTNPPAQQFYLSPFFPRKYSQITNASPCQQGLKIGEH